MVSEEEEDTYTLQHMFLTGIISCIYILLVSKFAELASLNYNQDGNSIENYVMIIYLISIIGLVFVYIFFKDTKGPDLVMKYSLNISNLVLVLYTISNYWEYLDDYTKCTLLITCFMGIVFYLYKSNNTNNIDNEN